MRRRREQNEILNSSGEQGRGNYHAFARELRAAEEQPLQLQQWTAADA